MVPPSLNKMCIRDRVKTEKAEKAEINEIHLRDKDSLYENDDDTSVVTMYLTCLLYTSRCV